MTAIIDGAVEFFVAGVPIQQGSARAFVRNGKAQIVSDTKRDLKGWRSDIATEARRQFDRLWLGPVHINADFVMPRPKSTPKKLARPLHTKTPDVDKLLRAVLDALTGVAYRDDAQVAEVNVTKCIAGESEQSGVRLQLWEATR